jgi:CRISPR system Cascade subunit CasE
MGVEVPTGTAGEPDVRIVRRQRLTFAHGARRVTLVTVTYEGRLRVVDPAPLRRTLVRGVGHARAYGCGLMTLAPAR